MRTVAQGRIAGLATATYGGGLSCWKFEFKGFILPHAEPFRVFSMEFPSKAKKVTLEAIKNHCAWNLLDSIASYIQ